MKRYVQRIHTEDLLTIIQGIDHQNLKDNGEIYKKLMDFEKCTCQHRQCDFNFSALGPQRETGAIKKNTVVALDNVRKVA